MRTLSLDLRERILTSYDKGRRSARSDCAAFSPVLGKNLDPAKWPPSEAITKLSRRGFMLILFMRSGLRVESPRASSEVPFKRRLIPINRPKTVALSGWPPVVNHYPEDERVAVRVNATTKAT
jgi:hypothetical protein